MCSPLADVGPGFENPQSSPSPPLVNHEESTRQSQASVSKKMEETIEIDDDDDSAEATATTRLPAQTMDDSQRTGSPRLRLGGR